MSTWTHILGVVHVFAPKGIDTDKEFRQYIANTVETDIPTGSEGPLGYSIRFLSGEVKQAIVTFNGNLRDYGVMKALGLQKWWASLGVDLGENPNGVLKYRVANIRGELHS